MKLNTIKSSFFCILGSYLKLLDDLFNVFMGHFLRFRMRTFSVCMRSSNCNRTRSKRFFTTDEFRKNSSTRVPDLEDNLTTLFVYLLSDFLPSFNLFLRVDTTRTREGIRKRRNLTAFSQNKTKSGSLTIVFNHEIIWNTSSRITSASSHGSHDEPIFKLNRTQFVRF